MHAWCWVIQKPFPPQNRNDAGVNNILTTGMDFIQALIVTSCVFFFSLSFMEIKTPSLSSRNLTNRKYDKQKKKKKKQDQTHLSDGAVEPFYAFCLRYN